MKKPSKKPQPVKVGQAHTFNDVMERARRLAAERDAKLAAMSDEERDAFLKDEEKRYAEAEKLLQQLRGTPGFSEFRIKAK